MPYHSLIESDVMLIPYYRARYYSPQIGRFLSRDPLKDAELSQGPNPYWYVQNNPSNKVDPSGMGSLQDAIAYYNQCVQAALIKYNKKVDDDTKALNQAIANYQKVHDGEIAALQKALAKTIATITSTVKDHGRRNALIVAAQQTEEAAEAGPDTALDEGKLTARALYEVSLTADDIGHQLEIRNCCTKAKQICPQCPC